MKKRIWQVILLAVVVGCSVCAPAFPQAAAAEGEGRLEYVDGVRVLHLKGSPREMGRQHGILIKKEINDLVNYFFEKKENVFGASPEGVAKGAEILKKHIPDRFIEEMKGIAEGAGIEFEKILYMNTFLDTVSAGWVSNGPQCSNFAAMRETTKAGAVIHGRNLDWSSNDFLAAANTVIFYSPDEGVPFAALSWPGMVGTLTGLNAEKISMGEMTSMSPEATLDGTPIMIHLRMLLQFSTNLDEAYKILSDNPRTTGYNVLVTDGEANDAFVAEMTAEHIYRTGPKNGFIHHTNHFLHPKLAEGQKKFFFLLGKGRDSDTFHRYGRLETLLEENKGAVDEKKAMDFLGDKFDPKEKVIDEEMNRTVCRESTLQSVVMLPESGELYVALKKLPAPDGGYVRLKLDLADNEE